MKVTFNEASSRCCRASCRGPTKYRFSMTFEVGPVMIAPAATPSYALLIGVDYAATTPANVTTQAWASRSSPPSGR